MFHTELFKILIDVFFSGPQRGSREEPRRKTILCINTIRTVSFLCVFLAGLIVYKLCLFVFTLPFQRCVCGCVNSLAKVECVNVSVCAVCFGVVSPLVFAVRSLTDR